MLYIDPKTFGKIGDLSFDVAAMLLPSSSLLLHLMQPRVLTWEASELC